MSSSRDAQRSKLVGMRRRICQYSVWFILSGTLCACWVLRWARTPGAYATPVQHMVGGQPAPGANSSAANQAPANVHSAAVYSPSMGQSNSTARTAYGCPMHPIYNDSWVKENVVLTYALGLRDGLGGQVQRIMGIYAIAKALGLGYVHSPFECIGHIGPYSHYRDRRCNDLEARDQLMLQRVIKHLSLPDTTDKDVTHWKTVRMGARLGAWEALAGLVEQAAKQQQPTVIQLEMILMFINYCPDVFHHVPSWWPQWIYQRDSRQDHTSSQPWLLTGVRPVRIAVHMRRGDLGDRMTKRGQPASYYINIVQGVTQILDNLNHDYTVEWFTEPSGTQEGQEELNQIRQEVPNLSIHLDTDLLWNWHQMAAADIFVMSLSGYSDVPAILNRDGLLIRPIPRNSCTTGSHGCKPSNWLEPRNNDGVLSEVIIKEIHRRWGSRDKVMGVRSHQQQHHQHIKQR